MCVHVCMCMCVCVCVAPFQVHLVKVLTNNVILIITDHTHSCGIVKCFSKGQGFQGILPKQSRGIYRLRKLRLDRRKGGGESPCVLLLSLLLLLPTLHTRFYSYTSTHTHTHTHAHTHTHTSRQTYYTQQYIHTLNIILKQKLNCLTLSFALTSQLFQSASLKSSNKIN